MRCSIYFPACLIVSILSAVKASKRPSFLGRHQLPSTRQALIQEPSSDDIIEQRYHLDDVLECDYDDDSDSDVEGRYALQYVEEMEYMRTADSSYLLRGAPQGSKVISASAKTNEPSDSAFMEV